MVCDFMKEIIFFNIMLLFFILNLLLFSENYYISIFFTVFNLLLTFYLVNRNKYSNNIINPQTILLLGMSFLIFGRFFAVLFDDGYLANAFCINFIYYYCSSNSGVYNLIIYLNCILIFISLAFILPVRVREVANNNYLYFNMNQKKINLIFFLGSILTLYLILENFYKIRLVVNSGYLSLYEGQSEEYETPYSLLINALSVACLSLLFALRGFSEKTKKLFYFLFFIVVFKLLMAIGTGSRSHFIAGLILLIWLLFYNRKLNIKHYLLLFFMFFTTITGVNYLASLSGGRVINSIQRSFFENIAYIFYNQGTSLMVFDISLKYSDYPILGFWKVIFPGIQIFYNLFGVSERKDFNWSSYVVYNENYGAYINGNGLGWSLYSDFYVFSFGFIPLFCLIVFYFSRFILKVISSKSLYCNGLVLIMISTFFTINRSSISGFIFILIVYTVMYFIFIKVKWK